MPTEFYIDLRYTVRAKSITGDHHIQGALYPKTKSGKDAAEQRMKELQTDFDKHLDKPKNRKNK